MKSFLFTAVLLVQITVFAAANKESCKAKAQKQNEMNKISSNIANLNNRPDLNLENEMQKMIDATRAYEAAAKNCPLTSEEACEKAQEKKATYNFLVKKLSKINADPTIDIERLMGEIKRTTLDYKELNSQCKR